MENDPVLVYRARLKGPSQVALILFLALPGYENLHFQNLLWLLDSYVMLDWDFGSDADSLCLYFIVDVDMPQYDDILLCPIPLHP